MTYLWRYFREDVKITFTIAVLVCWCFTSSYFAFTNKKEVLLLQVNGFDTRVLSDSKRPIIEVENFFHNFSGLFYTYNSHNFEDHMNRVVPMIDLKVMRSFQEKINSMFEKLQSQSTEQYAYILKITRISELDYDLKMKVERRSQGQEFFSEYTIRTSVERISRSLENPYGLRIVSLKELHD